MSLIDREGVTMMLISMQAQALFETRQRSCVGLETSLQGAESFRSTHRVRPRPLDQPEAECEDPDKAVRICPAVHSSMRTAGDARGVPPSLYHVVFRRRFRCRGLD